MSVQYLLVSEEPRIRIAVALSLVSADTATRSTLRSILPSWSMNSPASTPELPAPPKPSNAARLNRKASKSRRPRLNQSSPPEGDTSTPTIPVRRTSPDAGGTTLSTSSSVASVNSGLGVDLMGDEPDNMAAMSRHALMSIPVGPGGRSLMSRGDVSVGRNDEKIAASVDADGGVSVKDLAPAGEEGAEEGASDSWGW